MHTYIVSPVVAVQQPRLLSCGIAAGHRDMLAGGRDMPAGGRDMPAGEGGMLALVGHMESSLGELVGIHLVWDGTPLLHLACEEHISQPRHYISTELSS